jgi:hypothetical protein
MSLDGLSLSLWYFFLFLVGGWGASGKGRKVKDILILLLKLWIN